MSIQVSEHIEQLVNLLKRDESKETMNEGVIEAVGEDGDDEDDKIEEV